jgi:hypothetical protein
MRKLSIYRLATYSTIVFISMALFNWQNLTANSTESNQSVIRQIHYKNTIAQSSSNWLLDRIISLFTPSHRSGGARGDNSICADSPRFDENNAVLWTRQPLFIWKGSAVSIAVISEDRSVFWMKNFQPNLISSSIKIDKPLELGKKYTWTVIADPNSKSVNPQVAFQTVSIKKYKEISKDLMILEDRLKRQQADRDEIILSKVQYFANKNMWGDVQNFLQEIPSSSQYYQKSLQILTEIKKKLSRCTERY